MTARYPLVLNGTSIQELQTGDSLNLPSPLSPTTGGTGVANGANNTITFTGNYTLGITLSTNTNITFPSSGTLATTAQAASTGKAIAMSLIFGF